jgi:hypothetical protein
VKHCTVSQNGKVERRPVESDELRRERRDLFHEGRDQLLLGSLSDVRCPKRIHNPATIVNSMRNQRTNADDRVIDMLRELVTEFGSNLIIALASVTIRSSETFQVRDGFDIPNDELAHVAHSHVNGGPCVNCPVAGRD